jgi:hypothetical protein
MLYLIVEYYDFSTAPYITAFKDKASRDSHIKNCRLVVEKSDDKEVEGYEYHVYEIPWNRSKNEFRKNVNLACDATDSPAWNNW